MYVRAVFTFVHTQKGNFRRLVLLENILKTSFGSALGVNEFVLVDYRSVASRGFSRVVYQYSKNHSGFLLKLHFSIALKPVNRQFTNVDRAKTPYCKRNKYITPKLSIIRYRRRIENGNTS